MKISTFNTVSNSTRLVAINYYKDWFWDIFIYWSDIFSTHIFKKLRTVSTLRGVSHPYSPYYTHFSMFNWTSKIAAVSNISFGSFGEILIHNWVMKDHMVWNCVSLGYRLKTTYISRSLLGQTGKNSKNIYFYLLTTPLTSWNSAFIYNKDNLFDKIIWW